MLLLLLAACIDLTQFGAYSMPEPAAPQAVPAMERPGAPAPPLQPPPAP